MVATRKTSKSRGKNPLDRVGARKPSRERHNEGGDMETGGEASVEKVGPGTPSTDEVEREMADYMASDAGGTSGDESDESHGESEEMREGIALSLEEEARVNSQREEETRDGNGGEGSSKSNPGIPPVDGSQESMDADETMEPDAVRAQREEIERRTDREHQDTPEVLTGVQQWQQFSRNNGGDGTGSAHRQKGKSGPHVTVRTRLSGHAGETNDEIRLAARIREMEAEKRLAAKDAQLALQAVELKLLQQKAELAEAKADHERNLREMAQRQTTTNHHGPNVGQKSTIDSIIKEMKKYDGTRDAARIDAYLADLNSLKEHAEYTDAQVIDNLGFRLSGRAKIWWSTFKDSELPRLLPDDNGNKWTAVQKAFRQEFMPLNWEIEEHGKWHQLEVTEKGGLTAYITAFRTAIHKIPNLSEQEQWRTLWFHIDREARSHLEYQKITTTYPALNALQIYAQDKRSDDRKKIHAKALRNYDQDQKKRKDRSSSAGPSRDRKRVDAPRVDRSNSTTMDDTKVTMANYNCFETFKKLTPLLRAFLEQHKGCTYCRKLNVNANHGSAQDCRDRNMKQRQDFRKKD